VFHATLARASLPARLALRARMAGRSILSKKWYFLYYKSIESLSTRLNNFKNFAQDNHLKSIQEITYRQLLAFVADYRRPSIHVKKARVWALRQFFHFLKLSGNGGVGPSYLIDIQWLSFQK